MKTFSIFKTPSALLLTFLFLATGWRAEAQVEPDCSCEAIFIHGLRDYQSPYNSCQYVFFFDAPFIVEGENGRPGQNECVDPEDDSFVSWSVVGPGVNFTTTTTGNQSLVYTFLNGTYTICASRIVALEGDAGTCELSECTTLEIEGCAASDCSCELFVHGVSEQQSPFDSCQYLFFFDKPVRVEGENGQPGLNECLVSADDEVRWSVMGPGIDLTATTEDDPLVQTFFNGTYTICASRDVVVLNPDTNEPEACEISECKTITVTDCEDAPCECVPENLGVFVTDVDEDGCTATIQGSVVTTNDCWNLESLIYDWGDGSGAIVGNDLFVAGTHIYAANGTYLVTVTAVYEDGQGNTCQNATSAPIRILGCGGRRMGAFNDEPGEDNVLMGNLSIAPNPVAGTLIVKHPFSAEELLNVQITNTAGQTLVEYRGVRAEPTLTYPVADLPKGTYYLTFISENGRKLTTPFVKL